MPTEVKELKDFVQLFKDNSKAPAKEAKGGEGTAAKQASVPKTVYKKKLLIKTSGKITKFKLRTSRRLYTFQTDSKEVAKKLMSSVPSTIVNHEIKKKKKISKK